MFLDPANVLLLIMLLGHVLNTNLPDATLASLVENNYCRQQNGCNFVNAMTPITNVAIILIGREADALAVLHSWAWHLLYQVYQGNDYLPCQQSLTCEG